MTQANKVKEYIRECFDEFSLDYEEFFCYADVEDEDVAYIETPWENEDGSINMEAIEHASMVLGISVEDILSTNDDAIRDKLKRFPYLFYLNGFNFAYEKSFYTKEFDEIRLLETIFEVKLDKPYPQRYNFAEINDRLVSELKEINKFFPGTYHSDCNIENLTIVTKNFCSFSEIAKMVNSYMSMAHSAKYLFIKAVNEGLSKEEILNYNFFVSVFGLRDKYYPKGFLYYNELRKVNDFYKELTLENFNDVILFKHGLKFEPWKCAGFIENEELVKEYLNIFPEAKAAMGKYAVEALQFLCLFTWSDSELREYNANEAIYIHSLADSFGFSEDGRTALPERFYVRKTTQELGNDNNIAETLIRYSRPEKLGGIPVKMPPKYSSLDSVRHIEYLLKRNVKSSNFIKNILDGLNDNQSLQGGCGDE